MAKQSLRPGADGAAAATCTRLRCPLDAAHLKLERLDQMIEVAMEALRGQNGDEFAAAVITCLENTVGAELVPAKGRIEEALARCFRR